LCRASLEWAREHFGGPIEGIEARAQALVAAYSGLDLLDPAPPTNLVQPAGVSDLGTVAAPTLVIHGDLEMSFIRAAADLLAEGIPGAQRVIVPGAGHVADWQQPERFAAAVLEFLRGAERPAR
jgi:pimeloyl-ACP methyl ester carboxylesterase